MFKFLSPGASGLECFFSTRYRSLKTLAALAALAFAQFASADNVTGDWISPQNNNWPLIPIHAALTPDGRVLTYGTDLNGKQTGFFYYDVWNPASGLGGGHMTIANQTATDIFCSSQVVMPLDGTIFIAGGDNWTGTGTTNTGNNNSNLFAYGNNTLARGANMNRARWYSSSTVLINGEVYVQGGNGGADFPEVRQSDGTFRLLTGVNTSALAATFPRNFLAPDGRVFGYDTNGNMYYVTTAGTGSYAGAGQYNSANAGWTSSAAMYRPGKILQMGGNSSGAVVIDITGPTPAVTTQPTMSSKRQWVSATIMADGRVVATGGTEQDNALVGINNSAEIWNPATGQWFVGPSGSRARMYHSGALLLPDATVMVHGGGAPGPLNNQHAEIYRPSYLFLPSSTTLAPRPTIVSWPQTTIDNGQHFTLDVGTATISRVTMVRSGSVTHSVNMDQRFLELPFTQSGSVLDTQVPLSAGEAPGGYYMLFVIDNQGVPSMAKMLRLSVAANPNIALDYTPSIGGPGGAGFTVACNTDEALVGVAGRASTADYVYQLSAQCVRVDQFGHWVGSPVTRGSAGGTGGTPFTKTCPQDFAISGFSGRSATYVNQINLECKALTASGRVAGAAQALGAVGSTQGNANASVSCGTGNPVYAMYGRGGSWIDNFGVQCRQATITPIAVNSPPTVTNPGNQSGTVGVAVTLTLTTNDPDGNALTYSATGLPPGVSIAVNFPTISGTPTTAGSFNVSITATDPSNASGSANFIWTIVDQQALILNPMPSQTPRLVNSSASYTATTQNAINAKYKWFFDDGTPETAYSSSASISHAFANPGVYYVTVTATDDRGIPQVQTFAQTVYLPATANKPAISSNIAYEARSGSNSRVWVVNQDNDTVTAFDAVTAAKLAEVAVGTAPRTLAVSPGGEIWVTSKSSASISVINANTLTFSRTIALPVASQPFGIAFAPTGGYVYVALEGMGRLLKLDATSGAQVASVAVGANPRHLSVSGDGGTVYVSRFVTPRLPGEETINVQTQVGGVNVGGEVLIVNAGAMTVLNTVELAASTKADFENQGSGFPNYLGAAAISPDGTAAWVPSKQDNVARGQLRNQQNLNFQSTVRAISSRINLATGAEDFAARLDHDNSSVASAAAFDRYGVYLFVALETSREVAVVDAHGGLEIFRIDVGRAPQGLVVSPDGSKLYVNNFMDRSISVFDITNLVNNGQWNATVLGTLNAVGTEKLSAQVLKGKQFFYDARDTRLARDRYISCATCHNDGGQDGRVWDLGGFGEGLRNTIALRGRAGMGQGFLHWSANFNEVQDFEAQIRSLSGGTGLMADADFNAGTRNQPLGDPKAGFSADLDAMAAYLGSLNTFAPSPNRNSDGTLTTDAVAGKAVFQAAGCGSCHSGTAFTESGAATLRNVGTIKPSSGQRLGGPLTGLDTPTLRDVWATAPYLHDGSAATLSDAVRAHNNVTVSDPDLVKLVAYLAQIGSQEAAAPSPNVAPVVANPGTQTATVGVSTTLAVSATDGNGDTLTYGATGLPAGLSINASTGVITGTPTTVAAYSATVTATDPSLSSGSAGFSWNVAADSAPPNAPASLTASAISGTQINLSWSAATDNAAVTGYEIERCQGAGCSTFAQVATSATTSFSNTALTSATAYSYRVRAVDAAGNKGGYSPVASATTLDTSAPTAPASLSASLSGTAQINLSWAAATDNVAVTNYLIERCQGTGCSSFAQVATSATTSYSNTGLAAATSYSYRVRATDAAANLGGYSPVATAATPAGGATLTPTFVQRSSATPNTSGITSVAATFAAAQTAGNLNIVVIGWNDSTALVQSVNDSRGHSYVRAAGPTIVAGNGTMAIYYAANITASAANTNTVTVTFNRTTQYPDLRIAEYSGVATTNPVDGSIGATGTSTSASSGNLATTNANDLLIGANYVETSTSSAGTGFTSRVITTDGNLLEDRTVTALGSYSATANLSRSGWWIMQMVALRAGVSGPADTSAPTPPGSLTAIAASTTQINLGWAAASDNNAVTNYLIERCQGAGCSTFAQVATSTTTSYSNTGLAATTSYSYRVRATDAAGNLGGYSSPATATTLTPPPDTTAPAAPATLTAGAATSTQINLSWAAATDNVAVTNYLIERCQGAGCSSFAQVATSATTSYSNTGLAAATSYSYRVRATDAAANLGGYSPVATATTPAGGAALIPTFVQRTSTTPDTSGITSVAATFTAAQTAGNLNIVVIGWNDSTALVQSVNDSRGHSYVRAAGPTIVAGNGTMAIYYAANITASAANTNTVTVTFNRTTQYPDLRIAEYSGVATTNPVDGSIGATGTSTTASSGNLTTTNANDLLIGANYVQTRTSSAGTGFTSRVITTDGNLLEDRTVTALGGYSATANLSDSGWWIMQLLVLRAGTTP